jgi:predicted nucleic acid-binding protein
MIVLDTNDVSELMRSEPVTAVLDWAGKHPLPSLFTTTITQAEILFGLNLLPEGRRHDRLLTAATRMFEEDFAGRVLPFDVAAAREFAPIAAGRRRQGRSIGSFDTQIAAIAKSRRAVVATRNISDFDGCGLVLVNPWQD